MENESTPDQAGGANAPHRRPPAAASIHVRALLSWLVIFPLVAVGMTVTGPFIADWHPVLRALSLTVVVVPTAVYIGIPGLLRAYNRITRGQYRRRVSAS
jgi:antibiotic biosynthesis monooxygenase (ABM) superfamily enzyme